MAYFIRVNETNFKVPHRLIIGRGEPFSILNDDRSVARSHLLILKKKNKYFVKDLNTESGSMIDGKKIKTKKLIEVKPDVPVKIGNSEVVILSAQLTENFIEIKGNSLKVRTSDFNYTYILSFLFIIFAFMNVHSSWKEGKSAGFLVFLFFAQLVFMGIMGFLISKWIKLIKSMTPNQILNDVFFSDEGFTVHYGEGGNMTFKTDKIQAWSLGNHLIEVKMYGEKHILAPTAQQLRTFETFFNKHLKHKKVIEARSPASAYGFLICMGIMIFSTENPSLFQLGIAAAGILVMASAAMLAKPELRKYWVIPANRNFSPSKQSKSIIFSGLFALFCAHMMISNKDLIANYEACSGRNAKSCLEINFHDLKYVDLKADQELYAFACEQGNSTACYYKSQRDVASEE